MKKLIIVTEHNANDTKLDHAKNAGIEIGK